MEIEANHGRQYLMPGVIPVDAGIRKYLREMFTRRNVLAICAALVVTLTCIFLLRTSTNGVESNKAIHNASDDTFHELNPEITHISNFGFELWTQLFNMSQVRHLRFSVGDKDFTPDPRGKGNKIKSEFFGETLKISGGPSICNEDKPETPRSMLFENVTTLEVSNMVNCHHYLQTILGKWRYPMVTHLKMRNVFICKQEFVALGKFIQVHNETLVKVEIDEGFFCSWNVCDAGKLNFPEHDFEFIITRRKEASEWI